MGKSQKYLRQWKDTDRKSYVSLAKIYLEFLSEVTKYPLLINGDNLLNALRRYEMFWLPLCKRYGTMSSEDWAPPLDVAWVWCLHMITPVNYVNDCIRLIGNAPSHALKSGIVKEKALMRTKELWNQAYSSCKEPFDVDLTVPCACHYDQTLPHDFYDLSRKQQNFYYQVSLPHFRDDTFLDYATARYVTHLDLQMNNPSICLILPSDVQLIMQTHQLNPIFYQWQIGVILGKVVNYEHNYLLDCKTNLEKRHKAEAATRILWKKAGYEYSKPGTIYRGDLPLRTENLQKYSVPVEYDVSVTRIELIPLESYNSYALLFQVTKGSETSKTKIKIEQGFATSKGYPSHAKARDSHGIEYVQLEDFSHERKPKSKVFGFNSQRYSLIDEDFPQNNRKEDVLVVGDGSHALMNYRTNVARSTKVEISLLEVNEIKLPSAESCIGRCQLDVFKFFGSNDEICSEGRKQKVCLPLEFSSDCPSTRLTLVLSPIVSGHNVFQVKSEDLGLEQFAHIDRALSYPTLMLPLGMLNASEASAEVMTYPIKDYRGKETFSCRIVRSTSELFYAIEILDNEGTITATSHLLSKIALPFQSELFSTHQKAFFQPDKQQYVMIIRGLDDWGLCYGQQLRLSPSEPFFGLKLFLLHENANECCYVHKYRGSLYMFTLSSAENRSNDAHIYLHLAEGKVVITGNLKEIPEILAFLMSALILRYIFCEKSADCWTVIDSEGMDLLNIFQGSDDVGLLWDGIYAGDEACVAAYRAVVSKVEC